MNAFIYFVSVGVLWCVHVEVRGQYSESIISFFHVGLGDRTQAVRLQT